MFVETFHYQSYICLYIVKKELFVKDPEKTFVYNILMNNVITLKDFYGTDVQAKSDTQHLRNFMICERDLVA